MSEKKRGNAKHSKLHNDLFWEFHTFTKDRVWLSLKWWGYNDYNWWHNVAPTDAARTAKGQDGKTYRIDFNTSEVFEVMDS